MTEGLRLPDTPMGPGDAEIDARIKRWDTLDESELTLTRLQIPPINMPRSSQPQLDHTLLNTLDPKAYSERYVAASAWYGYYKDRYNCALLDLKAAEGKKKELEILLKEDLQKQKRAIADKSQRMSDKAITAAVEGDSRVRELALEVHKKNELATLIEGRMGYFSKVEKVMSRYIEMIKVGVQMDGSNAGQPRRWGQ